MLALPILTIGGRDAAFVFGLVERHCFYDITLAYDEGFARLSPGMHLIQEMLREFAAEGIQTVVSHGAHDYKKHWASAFARADVFFCSRRPARSRHPIHPLLVGPGVAPPGLRRRVASVPIWSSGHLAVWLLNGKMSNP
jgi:CelD/BcsL family acetyltransferase involved in cellulose biosynthesis